MTTNTPNTDSMPPFIDQLGNYEVEYNKSNLVGLYDSNLSSWDYEELKIVQKSTQAYSEASSPRGASRKVTLFNTNQKHAQTDKSAPNPDT